MDIALIQAPLQWENPKANRNYFAARLAELRGISQLVLLPEMFSTGFTMFPKPVAETMDGETVTWMRQQAMSNQLALTGSLVIEEHGKYYNRLLFVYPSGEIKTYDKRHLFSFAGENESYTAGSAKLVLEYQGWKMCLLVCFDLRFPVFSRNVERYDLLLYVANWPEARIHAWDILLKARAVENVCYVAAVNRVGQDGNQHPYNGHSQVIDPLGNLVTGPTEQETVLKAQLDLEHLHEIRQKFAFLDDQDAFTFLD